MTMLTDDERAAIIKRVEATTPGPWRVESIEGHCMDYIVTDHPDHQGPNWERYVGEAGLGGGQSGREQMFEQNAAFMAAARQDIPALLARIAELEARLAGPAMTDGTVIRFIAFYRVREIVEGLRKKVAKSGWDEAGCSGYEGALDDVLDSIQEAEGNG